MDTRSFPVPGPGIPKLKTLFDEDAEQGEKKPRVPINKLFGVTRSAFRLVWETGRGETLVVLGLNSVIGFAPLAQVIVGKWALDALLSSGSLNTGLTRALPFVIAVFFFRTLAGYLGAVAQERQRLLTERVSRNSQIKLIEKALSLDLEAFETPSFYDQLSRGQQEATMRPWMLVMNLTSLISSAATVAGFVIYLLRLEPMLMIILSAAYVPLWLANVQMSRARYMFRVHHTTRDRKLGYLSSVMTQLETAKEVRAFGLGTYLLGRYRELSDEKFDELRALMRKNLKRSLSGNTVSTILSALGLALLIWLASAGRMSLSEMGAALAALLLMGQRLGFLIGSANGLYESALFIEDFWAFLDLKPKQITAGSSERVPEGFDRIVLEEVTFYYPETARPALSDVSLEIPRGRTVALVGENGSGKTTLAKLLTRLYDPQGGRVRWDERDLRTCDPDTLRKSIAVIFQDFAQYKLTAKENIGFGDIAALDNISLITEAARHAGAHDFIEALPDGYESMLGRLFHKGNELSVGQWQKVALARAFFRNAPLVILDEPTASLDARSEYQLFNTMKELFKGRSVLLISHRFSSVRMADYIYVLKGGKLVEEGTHSELMSMRGLYAELFELQASAYLDSVPPSTDSVVVDPLTSAGG